MTTKNDFSGFTNLYELSKTLRFELKPLGETQKFLEKDLIIQKDKEVEENYNKIKVFFDSLHREFVKQSLENGYLNLIEDFYNSYIELNKNPENKKNKTLQKDFEKSAKDLKKEFVSFFESKGNDWKQKYIFLKKGGIDVLNEKEVLDLMALFYPEQKELFKKFDKFFTYFSNFKESRKNFYAEDGRAGAVATRAIDENLITFIKNLEDFKKFQNNFSDFISQSFSQEEKQVFELDFYNSCLLQDGIDNYNKILGGYSLENGNKIQGVNEKINLFKQNQTHSNSKDIKFPKFKLLYKQILSEKEKIVFIDEIENDEKLLDFVKISLEKNKSKIIEAEKIINNFIKNNSSFELDKIYLSKVSINTISNKYFASWDYILKEGFEKGEMKDFVSFEELKNAFIKIKYEKLEDIFKNYYFKENNKELKDNVIDYEKNIYQNFLNVFFYEFKQNIKFINNYTLELEKLFLEKFEKIETQVETIKNYFDSVLSLYKMTKYFALEKAKKKEKEQNKKDKDINIFEIQTDNNFYNDYYLYYTDFEIWKDYNLVRNFVTKKQVQTDKFKLNFNNSQFLTGWDKDKEKERLGIIMKKDEKFYLGVFKNNKVLDNYKYESGDFYEKMNYKQNPGASKMIPKGTTQLKEVVSHFIKSNEDYIVNSKSFIEPFKITKRIFDLNNILYSKRNIGEILIVKSDLDKKDGLKQFQKEYFTLSKDYEVYKKALTDWIDFCKYFLSKYETAKNFDYSNLKDSKEYEQLDNFYKDVEIASYSLKFSEIDSDFIEEKIKLGELYLFQIYNKDFSEFKKAGSKENIHTKYFKLLFDEKNLENLVIKLSGGAEIFFRDKTDKLKQKTRLLKDSNQEEKIFFINKDGKKKEVLEHRRYSQDKIMLHLSITLNANTGDSYGFNKIINEYLNKNEDIKIIGIDRGEKHLAYYSVIDKNGKIYEIDTLNNINGVNYLEKLEKIELSRKDARVSWGEIENIKELKNGYISQVVNKLAELIIKHNAIIVFEDLNQGFKRGRQKIEKQIYQKLELSLAKKLNYLTLKDKKDDEVLGNLKALQLVPKVNDYQDIANYKQSGIMFYTRANYTSTTCPCCGFRKNIYISNSDTKEKQKKVFEKIDIQFDGEKFIFSYEIEQDKKAKQKSNKTSFAVSSNFSRFKYNPLTKEIDTIDITSEFKKIFENLDLSLNINEQIKVSKGFSFLELTKKFNLLLQLRNSDTKNNIDYIICPSCNFHSKKWFQELDYNADANGAYNIARKGIIMLDRIEKNFEKPDLYVSDIDWDNFTQNS